MPINSYGNLLHRRKALWKQPYSPERETALKAIQAIIDATPEGGAIVRHNRKLAKGWAKTEKAPARPKPDSFSVALEMFYGGLTAEEAQYIQGQYDIPVHIAEEQRRQHQLHGQIVAIVKGRFKGELEPLYKEIAQSEKHVKFLQAQQELPLPRNHQASVISRNKYRAAQVLTSPFWNKVTVKQK